ncbi:MAG: hypothetical protein LBN37_05655 [Bacteroidales bacterium]|nr:hypothetical protein [Bacteroidales bacterium]
MIPEPASQPEGRFYRQDTTSAKWIRDLKNIILISPAKESVKDTFNVVSDNEQYRMMQGRTISRIRVIRLDPFGSDIDAQDIDTHPDKISFLERAGNAVHITTREFVIRNALYFHEGDTVNALKLADSERYLRSLHYINDARISALPIGEQEAEIVVITQDVLPYGVDLSTNLSSKGNFALSDRNIFGWGFDIKAGVFMDTKRTEKWGYEVDASMRNIARSHISIDAIYRNRFKNEKTGVVLNRDFYTPSTKYAGNLTVYKEQMEMNYAPDSSYSLINPVLVRLRYSDGWIGRSFLISGNAPGVMQNNITVALRAQKTDFLQRPENSQNLYYLFQNRTVYLASLSFSRQGYYKTNLIYNYGRTEDIPRGFLLSVVGGKEHNEQYNRPYVGVNTSMGQFIPWLGYLSGSAAYGTFLYEKRPQQGSLDFAVNYFSNLFVTGSFKQRFFANMQISRQLDTQNLDYMKINGDTGIPGFRNDSVYGRRRLNLSMEHNLFAPWDVYGFRMVWYAFANFSWLGGYDSPVLERTLYTSFGCGIRIRNNRFIINTIQLQFAYFPYIPANSRFDYFTLSKETLLNPRNFSSKAPEIIKLY